MVLVGRQRRHAQDLDDLGDAVDAAGSAAPPYGRWIEERAHVAILDRAAEQPAALDHHLGLQDGVEARREHGTDRAGKAHLVAA